MPSPTDMAAFAQRQAQERHDRIIAPYADAIDQVQHLYDHFAKTVNEGIACALMVQAAIMLTPIEDA